MVTVNLPQPSALFAEIRAIALEAYAMQICEAAGVEFKGIQLGCNSLESIVLFNEPHGSTLAVGLSTISVESIKARLAAYEMETA